MPEQVKLTHLELKVLLHVIGSTTDYPDALEAMGFDGTEKAALQRAINKLEGAYRRQHENQRTA